MSTPPNQMLPDLNVSMNKPGTVQFGRKFSFIVGTSAGQGVELGAFRCVFHIQRGDLQNPNSADVRVYNLSQSTANGLAQKEFTQFAIQGGYPGNYGLIFRGTLAQVRKGRESQTDSYVDFTGGDGDEAYNFATISASLAAGGNIRTQALNAFLESMADAAILPGDKPTLQTTPFPRGRVYHGMTRDELRIYAASNDLLWSIQDGKLTLIPQTSYIAGDPVLLSSTTGLIGVPEQTANGINMRVLLNPSIKIGQLVKLDSSVTVNQYRYSLAAGDQAQNDAIQNVNQINANGLYYVMRADHLGDTRGNDWYTDLVCLSVDATLPVNDGGGYLKAFQASGGSVRRRGA